MVTDSVTAKTKSGKAEAIALAVLLTVVPPPVTFYISVVR
jgi:hypothetical protein